MRSGLIAGLDLGAAWTRVVLGQVVEERHRPEVRILGVGRTPTEGMRKDAVTDLEQATACIRQSVKDAELMSDGRIDRVHVGVSGDHAATERSVGVVAVAAEEIVRRDVDRVHDVARAVALPPDRELLHALPQEYVVDHRRGVKDPVGMSATRLETDLYLVTASATALENIARAVEKAGYRVESRMLEPLAAARAVLTEDEKELGVAMIDLGAATTGLAVYYEGGLRALEVFSFGGAAITGDLIRGLQVPHGDAKQIKEFHGAASARIVDPREMVELPVAANGRRRSVARRFVAQIIEERLESMFATIRERLEGLGPGSTLGAGVVITGGGAAIPGAAGLAQEALAAPVRVGVPREGLGGLFDAVARPGFAVATGLALAGADRFMETGEGGSTMTSGLLTRAGAWLREFF